MKKTPEEKLLDARIELERARAAQYEADARLKRAADKEWKILVGIEGMAEKWHRVYRLTEAGLALRIRITATATAIVNGEVRRA